MKHIKIKTLIGAALMTTVLGSCSKILDEKPRASYTPDFFTTEKGVQGGISSLYSHLRSIYGQGYYYNTCETGTDEATYAASADDNFKVMDISGQGNINSSNSRTDAIFAPSFSDINTASGIIENGTKIGISNALLAEAKFFRGFDYFLLVQTFGGVPLDLGSGELKFNNSAVRTSVRNTVPEVYTKAIFPDLLAAINDLPTAARVTGGVTKNVARLYLAKAYLTYAWWLQNPNNIPTYPAVANRTDPAGKTAQNYFQMAYDIAVAGIATPGAYGLQPTYYDVNVAQKDRNIETMLYADHTDQSSAFNGNTAAGNEGNLYDGNAGGTAPQNFAVWMMTWNYTNIRSSTAAGGSYGTSSVQREAEQHLGRPYIRMCPTIGVFKNTFVDKTNDSRYDGTFTTVYRGNWQKGGVTNPTLYNANSLPVTPGSAILSFLNDEPTPAITYPTNGGNSGVGAGTLPGRADWVVGPNGISRFSYPGLWKMGTYRTDNGTGLGYPNASLTRPFNIAKFSEFFFIAAEAAVKGATTSAISGTYANDGTARGLLNIIRARAGRWSFNNNGNVAYVADFSATMTAATPTTIDINYILAERSREFFGEGYRWYDLIRTQKWNELASTYQICGAAAGDHNQVTVTRSIDNHHYLRPIPQSQLDAMQATTAEKAAYQNPGY